MSPTSSTVAPPPTEHSFADLGATPTTLTSLARVGIEHPFPIQTLCLPLALATAATSWGLPVRPKPTPGAARRAAGTPDLGKGVKSARRAAKMVG